ncbi:MAG TPA: Fe3+-siderophores ABC transporter protein [Gammaproteobacteria bacterium]|nr:Fe3+-siderophores ABC transporter protein [Gammaproteobacteria bacterium]
MVGRTRYCIHPREEVRTIPIVGGTKSVDWQKVEDLRPDLVVMDREENTREMAEACPTAWLATHVTSLESVGRDLMLLGKQLGASQLEGLASNWLRIADIPDASFQGWASIPGIKQTIGESATGIEHLDYMIWRDPWMAVGPDTFIGSMLRKVGLGAFIKKYSDPYPQITNILPEPDTFYLFSTEPYPFKRHSEELAEQGFQGALIDGELYSWFGIRSYEMLEAQLNT